MNRMKHQLTITALLISALLLASCATTGQPAWKKHGRQTAAAVLKEDITLSARVGNVPDGTPATITIIEQTTRKDTPLSYQIESEVRGGKVSAVWTVQYDADDDVSGFGETYEQPSYAFFVEAGGEKSELSKPVKLYADVYMRLSFQDRVLADYPYVLKLADGCYRKGKTDKDGLIAEKKIPLGKIQIF